MRTLLIREIPDKLHKAFKMYSMTHDISMNKMLKRLMEKELQEGNQTDADTKN